MPKLGLDASTDEIRAHIMRLENRKLINISEYNAGDKKNPIKLDDDIMLWDETNVRKYYFNGINNKVFKDFDELIKKEQEVTPEVAEEPKKAKRPSITDPEFEKRLIEIRQMRLDEAEANFQRQEVFDELEYRQYVYDVNNGKILNDEQSDRFLLLDEKFSADDYSKQKKKIEDLESKLEKQEARVKEFGLGHPKPNLLQKAWNIVHKWIYKKDSKVVREYNKQVDLVKKRDDIAKSISKVKANMDTIEGKHANFNYSEHVMDRDTRILLQARNIVLKQIALANGPDKPAPTLPDDALNTNIKYVADSDAFKKTVDELDAGSHEVNGDTFFNRFMDNLGYKNAKNEQNNPENKNVVTKNVNHENPQLSDNGPKLHH